MQRSELAGRFSHPTSLSSASVYILPKRHLFLRQGFLPTDLLTPRPFTTQTLSHCHSIPEQFAEAYLSRQFLDKMCHHQTRILQGTVLRDDEDRDGSSLSQCPSVTGARPRASHTPLPTQPSQRDLQGDPAPLFPCGMSATATYTSFVNHCGSKLHTE